MESNLAEKLSGALDHTGDLVKLRMFFPLVGELCNHE